MDVVKKEEHVGNDVMIWREARVGFSEWSNKSLSERCKILEDGIKRMLENKEELALLIRKEIGKDRLRAEKEVICGASWSNGYMKEAYQMREKSLRVYEDGKIYIRENVPYGVVLAISPYPYPIALSLSKIVPALLMGNSVVWKPSSLCPQTSETLLKLFQKAKLPENVLQIVSDRNFLSYSPDVDFVHFTGRKQTAKKIISKVSVPHLVEYGGAGVAVVLEDAPITETARKIVAGAMSYSGQHCSPMKRVYVFGENFERLIQEIKRAVDSLVIGDPFELNADVVPLAREGMADDYLKLVEDTVRQGARKYLGGKKIGNLLEPVLLEGESELDPLEQTDLFAPIILVTCFSTLEEMIQKINSLSDCMQVAVFSKNMNHALAISTEFRTGMVLMNGKETGGPAHFPFEGNICIGEQSSEFSLKSMARRRTTVIDLKF